jgi:hypothetical protein
LATPNYSYEKRQRELAKKRKKEEKQKRKSTGGPDDGGVTDAGDAVDGIAPAPDTPAGGSGTPPITR